MDYRNRFKGKTVVITGASSGIGRLTALEFARRGANVGLLARSLDGLGTLAREVAERGGRSYSIPVDVASFEAVEHAARQIAQQFGGIDVWVNNAATSVYGEFDQIPLDEIRRVMDVNFYGQVHGLRAALPYLEKAPGGGRLIAILSVEAELGTPLQSAYTASKHALYGFYKSVHQELRHRRSKATVSTILPASISTPLFEHAKTYLGVRPRPAWPVYSPDRVVQAIVNRALAPQFSTIVGGSGRAMIFLQRRMPELYHSLAARTGYLPQRSSEAKAASNQNSSLYQPTPGTARIGGVEPVSKIADYLETRGKWLPLALGTLGVVGGAVLLIRRTAQETPSASIAIVTEEPSPAAAEVEVATAT